jgi:hypothetical protein
MVLSHFTIVLFVSGYQILDHLWTGPARVNQHPRQYLHLSEWGLLVAIFRPKTVRFELRERDLVQEAQDICHI